MAAGHAGAVLGAANSVAPRGVDQLKDSAQITGFVLQIPHIAARLTLEVKVSEIISTHLHV